MGELSCSFGQLYINKDGKDILIGSLEEIKISLKPCFEMLKNLAKAMGEMIGTFKKVNIKRLCHNKNKSKKRYINIGRAEKLIRNR